MSKLFCPSISRLIVSTLSLGRGCTSGAFTLRLNQTQRYLDEGNPASVGDVYAPLLKQSVPASLSEGDKCRLETIEKTVRPGEGSAGDPQSERPDAIGSDNTLAVEPSPAAQAVQDLGRTWDLSGPEREGPENSINHLIRKTSSKPLPANGYELLRAEGTPHGIQHFESRGTQGRVVIQKENQSLEATFTIERPPHSEKTHLRYVKV